MMSKIENAVQWIIGIANDSNHGYSQNSRWGTPDYDCSSLVISAFEQAGILVKSAGATYTGNMLNAFQKCGFEIVTDGTLRRGDVLLNVIHHTALYIGNNQMVEARISELGTTYGEPGDQTGKEICISTYRNYPWDYVLRYTEESDDEVNEDSDADADTISVGTPSALPVPVVGDKGNLVYALQHLLLYRGYKLPKWGADGDLGTETLTAMIEIGCNRIWEKLVYGINAKN